MDNLKQKTLSGFIYKLGERGASQAVSFIVQIILARLLLPEEFGIIALLLVFITILDVFVTYGFGNSLIVNKKSDDLDFSTCFYFGIILSLILYGIVYLCSPLISSFFYGKDDLDIIIKVMALRMPVSAVNTVQYAYIAKNMQFRLFFYANLAGIIMSGVLSIIMAYMNYGVWALVAQNLSNALFSTIILWFCSDWRPKWIFSFKRLKIIYDYGWKILSVGLVDQLFSQISSLVIAKKYSSADLAYYNRGEVFPSTGISLFEPTVSSVLFPSLSNCNDDQMMMKSITKRVTTVSTYLICGFMFLLAAIAKPLVVVLLTEKWLPCVIFLQICCISGSFRPVQVINNCVIRASGNSGLLLKLDLLKKGIGLILLVVSMNFGVAAIAFSIVLTNFISMLINIFPNRKILCYGYREQFKDIVSNMTVPLLVGIIVWTLSLLPLSSVLLLILQIILGGVLFVLFSEICKLDTYMYLKNMAFSIIRK